MAGGNVLILDGRVTMKDRLLRNRIGLEKVFMRDETKYGQYVLAIMGRVHVANLFYQKNVFARVTFDDWKTSEDFHGSWIESSDDGKSDVFSFGFTRRTKEAVDVEFALCSRQGGLESWDNNDRKNYRFHLNEDPLSTK